MMVSACRKPARQSVTPPGLPKCPGTLLQRPWNLHTVEICYETFSSNARQLKVGVGTCADLTFADRTFADRHLLIRHLLTGLRHLLIQTFADFGHPWRLLIVPRHLLMQTFADLSFADPDNCWHNWKWSFRTFADSDVCWFCPNSISLIQTFAKLGSHSHFITDTV